MNLEAEFFWIGLAWDAKMVEAILESPVEVEVKVRMPIVILGQQASDEDEARDHWNERFPHLTVDTVFNLQTLMSAGAVS
ncbi:MAG: hypothetical protein ACREIQ_07155 [Nitrospiria bacterium]